MRKLKIVKVDPGVGPSIGEFDSEAISVEDGKLRLIVFKSDDISVATLDQIRSSLRKITPDLSTQTLIFAVGQGDDIEVYEVEE